MSRPVGRRLTAAEESALRTRIGAGETPTAAARALGIGPRSAYRVQAEMTRDAAPAAAPPPAGPFRLGGSATDRRIVALTAEVGRLQAALRQAHQAALDDDAARAILGALAAAPAAPPDWLVAAPAVKAARTPEVPVTIWSDWHLGEVVSRAETNGINAYDPDIATERVKRLVSSTISLCRHHGPGRYPGAIVNLLGDFVSGGLHPELAKTDAEEVLPSVLRVRDLLVWALDAMATEFGRLYVPCTAGNHGRLTQKPEFKRYSYKNVDWLLYQLLVRHFAGRPEIRFDIQPANEVHFRVYGQRYLAMHGDMLGVKGGDGIIGSIGPIMRGEVKVGKQSAAIGRDYDVLIMGHWHQPLWLPRAIVANSVKGFDEYAKNALRAPPSEPSQPLWFVHPRRGITSRWDVKVETGDRRAAEAWVSWPEIGDRPEARRSAA